MPQRIDVPGMGIVEFPDGMSDDQITSAIRANTAPSRPDHGMDFAKSIPGGAVESAVGMFDLPELGAKGIDWATNKAANIPEYGARAIDWAANGISGALGIDEKPRENRPLVNVPRPSTQVQSFDQRFNDVNNNPADSDPLSKKIMRDLEADVGKFHQPETREGGWGKTFGGFLPAAIGGPGGILSRVATQAAIPAAATETAGHYTQGTKAETPARLAAALLAGPAAARAWGGKAIPSNTALMDDATRTYRDPAVTGRPVNPADAARVADDFETAIHAKGVRRRNMPGLYDDIDELRNLPANATVADVRSVRDVLSTSAQNKVVSAKKESMHSQGAVRAIDDYLDGISPEIKTANANFAAGSRSKELEKAIKKAELDAAGANSGQNFDANARRAVKGIVQSPKRSRGWNPAEIKQGERVDLGTHVGNKARYMANLLGAGGGLGQGLAVAGAGATGGYMAGGNEGAGAGAAAAFLAGRGFRGIQNASTRRQIRILDDMLRSRAPLSQISKKLDLPPQEVARLLLRYQAATGNTPAK